MYLLDTNVVAELMRPVPALQVLAWADHTKSDLILTSAINVAEIRAGIASLPESKRKQTLQNQADKVLQQFAGRVLAFDERSARFYADVQAKRFGMGRAQSHLDAQIAAIALTHRMTLVTRNTANFEHCGALLFNPWLTAPQPNPI